MNVSIHHTSGDTYAWQTRRYDLAGSAIDTPSHAIEVQRGAKTYDETITFYFRDLADLEQFAASINAQAEDARRMLAKVTSEHTELAPVAPQKKGR